MSDDKRVKRPWRRRPSAGGLALRDIAGQDGGVCEHDVDLQLRLTDFVTMSVVDPQSGQERVTGAPALVAFNAKRFQELTDKDGKPTDVWKFHVRAGGGAQESWAWVYVSGDDIATVRAASKVL